MNKYIVITTINAKTESIKSFENKFPDWQIILVGDRKSKEIEDSKMLKFLSVDDQLSLPFELVNKLPFNHYVRKNLGYLYALSNGADTIYDTDDDNAPYDFWSFPDFEQKNIRTIGGRKFINVYDSYTDSFVWPRGLPLDELQNVTPIELSEQKMTVGVWQGLADRDPDVDAIHRLLFNQEILFKKGEPLVLEPNSYCPFNSQNTLWEKEMIPYAYLPATVTFRFTDILRGYIAQRCLWEHGRVLGFTQATVYQERNVHDLMRDFESEIPCYLQTKKVVNIIDGLSLKSDFNYNLITIYETLEKKGIVKSQELELVKLWLKDINKVL